MAFQPTVTYLSAHRRHGEDDESSRVAAENALQAVLAAMEILDLNVLRWRIRAAGMGAGVRTELEAETQRALDLASQWWLRYRRSATATDVARYREGVRALTRRIPAWRPGALSADLLQRSGGPIRRGAPADLAEEVFLLVRRVELLEVLDLAECTGADATEVADLYFVLSDQLEIRRGGLGQEVSADRRETLRTWVLEALDGAPSRERKPDTRTPWGAAARMLPARGSAGSGDPAGATVHGPAAVESYAPAGLSEYDAVAVTGYDPAAIAGNGPTRRVRRLRSVVAPS
ncbi:NAD-glutamate dehydrogenase [Nocardia sp. NEAU-G5]|uniref:NAD-glutamate dehydrogenase n=1 Tax=Nocardia albiluteola TaxID=2842303 RepID=A0ABS6BCA0_9NOCA|nr:NAD-glutamate dehydrogenase domain-containing protein [Nocardia albiluteola]MBU3066838.1 NAD-glutamate dehydrogenase [Nocardia albiluteola]